jgi:NAD(P)-dependent dehydrogenase (short-subunit alcohol dehydrogenase family)
MEGQTLNILKRRNFLKVSAKAIALGVVAPSVFSSFKNDNSQKVVLITGCSSGFGRHMALTYARAGFKTFASMRSPDLKNKIPANELQKIGTQEGLFLKVLKLDITSKEEASEAVELIIREEGRLDILVNNAGIFVYSPIEVIPPELWRYQMETNLYGPMSLVGLVMPHMRRQKSGLIIQVSSRVGRVTIPGIGLYCTSKFALESATECAHYEATLQGIDFALIQPTAFDTNINRNAKKIYSNVTLPLIQKERYEGQKFHQRFLEQLDNDFSGNPTRNPQEVADLALKIALSTRGERQLRYPLGDAHEVGPVKEMNKFTSQLQRNALQGRYRDWFRK